MIRREVCLQIPNLSYDEFPSIRKKDDLFWDLSRFFVCILYGNEACFNMGLQLIADKRPNDTRVTI